MNAKMTVHHLGADRFAIDIRGHQLVVDQPSESMDHEAGPTPTELFVAALASCAAHFAHRVLIRSRRSGRDSHGDVLVPDEHRRAQSCRAGGTGGGASARALRATPSHCGAGDAALHRSRVASTATAYRDQGCAGNRPGAGDGADQRRRGGHPGARAPKSGYRERLAC
jgi:organic hydroperoxide reductase OsmC/OhrA